MHYTRARVGPEMRKLFVTVQRDDELIKMHFVNHKHVCSRLQ